MTILKAKWFHVHFWKTVKKTDNIKYQECRCQKRRIINNTGVVYSDGTHTHFYGWGYQPFDLEWLQEICKYVQNGKCFIDDITDKIDCTGKDHDLEHCGDYHAYKSKK